MRLNLDILHYHLSNITEIMYFPGSKKEASVKSPVFFEKSNSISGHVVIITPKQLSQIPDYVKDVIFICMGTPSQIPIDMHHDLLVITKNIPVEQIFNALQQVFDKFNEWDDYLKDIYQENLGYGELIDSCRYVTLSPISIIDENFFYIAYSKDASKKRGITTAYVDDYNHLPLHVVNEIISHPNYKNDKKIKEILFISGDINIISKNIFHNEKYIGQISSLIEKNPLLNKYNASILLHINTYIEKMYAKYNSFNPINQKMDRLHSLLPEILDGNNKNSDELEEELNKIMWLQDHSYVMACFESGHNYSKEIYADYFCPQIEKMWKGTCAFPYESRIIILVNLTIFNEYSKVKFHQALSVFLRESLTIAGISRNFKYFKNIPSSYEQTRIALEHGSRKNPTLWAFFYDNYALDYFIKSVCKNHHIESLCHPSVLTLRDYDNQTGSELYKTLYSFFSTGFNATKGAKKLNIHRSTFLNRMEKIQQITGLNLENWESRLHVALSFQIMMPENDAVL